MDEQPAAVEEEESDDEAIDMEVSTTFIFVKNDVFLFLLLSFTLKTSSLQDFVESGKLEEDTGVVEPTVEVLTIKIWGGSGRGFAAFLLPILHTLLTDKYA